MSRFEWITFGIMLAMIIAAGWVGYERNDFEWIVTAIVGGIVFIIGFYFNMQAVKYQRGAEELQKEIDKALGVKP
ncbi:MAG: hypothetical protein QME81_16840 [bacterium]|nr:hypothetical protein [bacterium]